MLQVKICIVVCCFCAKVNTCYMVTNQIWGCHTKSHHSSRPGQHCLAGITLFFFALILLPVRSEVSYFVKISPLHRICIVSCMYAFIHLVFVSLSYLSPHRTDRERAKTGGQRYKMNAVLIPSE